MYTDFDNLKYGGFIMLSQFAQWGNSQAVRFPKHLLDIVNMRETKDIEIIPNAEEETITIKKASQYKHKTTKERLMDVKENYTFEEWNTGELIGCEVINDEYV